MLYQLGALKIDVTPFNVDGVKVDTNADHVDKPVLGAAPPTEFVGEGVYTMRLTGALFPAAIGGLDELDLLHDMRASGTPQPVTRGDGRFLGWFAITSVGEAHHHIGTNGIGAKVQVSIRLKRSGKPSVFDMFAILVGLLT